MFRLRLEANQRAVIQQQKVAGAPVPDVFPCQQKQPWLHCCSVQTVTCVATYKQPQT